MEPGNRNCWLFDELRFWGYAQPKGSDFLEWLRRCEDRALAIRRLMADLADFPEREALDTARSVARFCWDNPTAGHQPDYRAKQSSRGLLSGITRRRATKPRDAQIVELQEAGWSQRKIARELGIGQASVGRSVKRGAG